jgi:hypothetical protein
MCAFGFYDSKGTKFQKRAVVQFRQLSPETMAMDGPRQVRWRLGPTQPGRRWTAARGMADEANLHFAPLVVLVVEFLSFVDSTATFDKGLEAAHRPWTERHTVELATTLLIGLLSSLGSHVQRMMTAKGAAFISTGNPANLHARRTSILVCHGALWRVTIEKSARTQHPDRGPRIADHIELVDAICDIVLWRISASL